MRPLIDDQNRSYKRGLILGLTMAEMMLLLVFCLLLMLGAFIDKFEKELNIARTYERELHDARERVIRLQEQIGAGSEDSALVEKLRAAARSKNMRPDEFWTELVRAKQVADVVEGKLEKSDDLVSALDEAIDAKRVVDQFGGLKSIETKLSENEHSHDKPPHIVLSEADGFFFDSGKAEIKPEFSRKLKEVIVPQIVDAMKHYDVDIVEVIGHTDSQPIAAHESNLDSVFSSIIRGGKAIGNARSSDNAGLGLMRAVAVVRALLENPSTKHYRILPFSAGQLIDTDETLLIEAPNQGVDSRRRIEIRLRKSLRDRSGK